MTDHPAVFWSGCCSFTSEAQCDINPNGLGLRFNESDNTHLALAGFKANAARLITEVKYKTWLVLCTGYTLTDHKQDDDVLCLEVTECTIGDLSSE